MLTDIEISPLWHFVAINIGFKINLLSEELCEFVYFLKEPTTKSQWNLLTQMNNFGIKFQDLQDFHKIVKMKNYGQRFVSKL